MTDIRTNALNCEAKKHAYRQTQDGVVVSFVLHPQEVPDGLATAALGTRYMLAMVEIGDDEQPKPAGEKRQFNELPRSQQAALALKREAFRTFMVAHGLSREAIEGEAAADVVLKAYFGIQSKADLDASDAQVGRGWDALYREFNKWLNEALP